MGEAIPEPTLQETVRDRLSYYRENVLPAIASGNLTQARRCLINLTFDLSFGEYDVFPFHSGSRTTAIAEILLEDIRRGIMPSREDLTEFEAYLAQLNLSVISGNRG